MDIRLCCVEAGEGFPLVLLHGNGEDHTYFKRQMGPFSQHFRVIAVDTRGHGESPRGTAPFTLEQFAEDLKEFLDGRSITRCHLLGFSDGGNIALLFALKYPEYVEKLILHPRHIEVQILADSQGHVIHLGERDCSIQRKNQKLMEESPARGLTPALREQMGRDAVLAAQAAGYVGAGTIEFVMDQEGHYYFIEMNTRIQVEHPVTEMVTGVDLVQEQIRIAAGLPLSHSQEDIHLEGHAIECRINAEDFRRGFLPCPGKTEFLHLPGGPGVRVDTALYTGYELSPYYDSLAAKVIAHAPTRLGAIRRMRRALEELVIEGYSTTAPLAHLILYHPDYIRGHYDTGFLEQNLDTLLQWEPRVEKEM